MKTNKPIIKSIIILTILSIIGTLCLYSKLPLEVPMHFDASGAVDNYGPRIFVLFTAILPLVTLLFLKVVPKLDPKGDAYLKHGKAYNICSFFIILVLIGIHWVTLGISLGLSLSVTKFIMPLTGILFIVIGNYMPQIKPNYTFGIKLPWTYNDEDNWRATHRMGGYFYVLAGILFIISGFVPAHLTSFITAGSLICLVLPMIYSYMFFRNKSRHKH